ncbi:MAG: hypothetical protein U0360_11460 [Dehalococcoidia bacterium]
MQQLAGFLWHIGPDQPSWDRACGLVGEHNTEVLGELGYTRGDVDDLLQTGALGDRYGP